MRLSKCIYSMHVLLYCLLIILFLFPSNAICGDKKETYTPDQTLIDASFKKAKELGHNPIPVYVEKKGGNLSITGGALLNVRNGRETLVENDMIINVGEFSIPVATFFPIPAADVTISKGEYAVVKGGKLVKQTGRITSLIKK